MRSSVLSIALVASVMFSVSALADEPSTADQLTNYKIHGQYGGLVYEGTMTRRDSGDQFQYEIEEIRLTFKPGGLNKLTNSVDEIVVKEIHLVATKKPDEGKGRYTILHRDKTTTPVVLTEATPSVTLRQLRFVVPKDIENKADHVGLGVTNGKMLWPIKSSVSEPAAVK